MGTSSFGLGSPNSITISIDEEWFEVVARWMYFMRVKSNKFKLHAA